MSGRDNESCDIMRHHATSRDREWKRVGSGWRKMSFDRRRCGRETRWRERKAGGSRKRKWKTGDRRKRKGFPLQGVSQKRKGKREGFPLQCHFLSSGDTWERTAPIVKSELLASMRKGLVEL